MPEGLPAAPPARARGPLPARARAWLAGLSGWRADLAAVLLGAAASSSLPPWHVLPALPLAFAGLLALIDAAPSGWRAARYGFWFGFGGHLVGLYWITEAILTRVDSFWWFVPFATPLTAAGLSLLFTAIPVGLARFFPRGLSRALGLSGLLALAAFAQGAVLTGFPWNLWGSVWALPGTVGDIFLQPAAWLGIYGLTLATLLLVTLPALGRFGLAAASLLLLAWFGAGLARLEEPLPPPSPLRIVLAQGDIPVTLDWTEATALAIFRTYLALTREGVAAASGHPLTVVWPETASPYLLARDGAARAAIAAAAGPGVPVLAGSIRFDHQGRPRNSLVVVDGPGPPAAIYDKWHLVPFGEYQPSWFPLPIQLVPGGGLTPGPGPRTLRVPGLPLFDPLICYEAIFSGEIVARPRPAWMVNITNDAWFGNTAGPHQALEAARMRAVEEGLPLLRAANSGISAAFDARGHEIARLGLDRRGILVVQLPAALPPTLYAEFGRAIPLLLTCLTIIFAFAVSFARPKCKC